MEWLAYLRLVKPQPPDTGCCGCHFPRVLLRSQDVAKITDTNYIIVQQLFNTVYKHCEQYVATNISFTYSQYSESINFVL